MHVRSFSWMSMPCVLTLGRVGKMKIVRRVVLTLSIILAVAVGFAWWYDNAGQHSNPDFDARVVSPAYPPGTPGSHPTVLMDAGHRDFHTASGRYKPFADLLKKRWLYGNDQRGRIHL